MKEISEVTEQTPAGSAAEEQKDEFAGFGDAAALAQAYGELESEFTRRTKRLEQLEAQLWERGSAEKQQSDESLYRAVSDREGVRARILSEYLTSLKGVPLMAGGGVGLTAPVTKAKTIEDAGKLALGYFRNQNKQ